MASTFSSRAIDGSDARAPFEAHDRGARDDPQPGDLRQFRDERIGHAVSEVALLGVAREVLQRQHRHRLNRPGGGSAEQRRDTPAVDDGRGNRRSSGAYESQRRRPTAQYTRSGRPSARPSGRRRSPSSTARTSPACAQRLPGSRTRRRGNGRRDCRCDVTGQRGNRCLQNRGGQGIPRLLGERPAAAGHLVQQHTERPDVAPSVGTLPTKDFGRHVRQRSGDCRCQRRHRRVGGRIDCRGLKPMRDAEVQHLRAAVVRDDDVLRFEIAVDDTSLRARARSRRPPACRSAGRVSCGRPRGGIRPLNGCPSTNSMTMNARSPASATSYTAQICG